MLPFLKPEKLNYVSLANVALGHIGESDVITDPDQASKPARAIRRVWEPTRQFVLAKGLWSFAVRTVDLAQRNPDENWPIALGRNAFPLPADMVAFVEILEPECLELGDDRFSIEGGPNGQELLCDETGPITVRYIRDGADVADPTKWPAAFAAAFAFRLAWQISDELGADKGRKDRALKAYDDELELALKMNLRTKPRRRNEEGDWVRARRSYGGPRAPGVVY